MRAGRLRTGWEGHLLLAHGSEGERLTGLAAWAQDGLDQGDMVMCAVPEARAGGLRGPDAGDPAATGLVLALERQGVPARAALAAGALAVVPVEQLAVPGVLRRRAERLLSDATTTMRVSLPTGHQRSVRRRMISVAREGSLESALNDLCRTGRFSALCQYDRHSAPEALTEVVEEHPAGLRTTMLTSRPREDGLALAGEVDICNVDLFTAMLETVLRAPHRTLGLDLADLRFMDVAGCRALARATRVFRNNGGRLVLVDPLPPVAHVLTLLGVDQLGGVEILVR